MRLVRFALAVALATAPLAAQAPTSAAPAWLELAGGSWQAVLPPPPAPGSLEDGADLHVMLDVQARRTPREIAAATTDQQIAPAQFDAVVGHPLDASLPHTAALLDELTEAVHAVAEPSKMYWHRPRPFAASPLVRPAIDKPGTPAHPSWSYPSGHSLWGYATALVLAAMLPEKREAILARGETFGWERVVGGVHWPSDVAAGRLAAVALVDRLSRDDGFRRELNAATTELRAALRLPPRAPDLP